MQALPPLQGLGGLPDVPPPSPPPCETCNGNGYMPCPSCGGYGGAYGYVPDSQAHLYPGGPSSSMVVPPPGYVPPAAPPPSQPQTDTFTVPTYEPPPMSAPASKICPECNGAKYVERDCDRCNEDGQVECRTCTTMAKFGGTSSWSSHEINHNRCPECGGRSRPVSDMFHRETHYMYTCPKCHGTKKIREACPTCGGSGRI